MTTRLKAYLTLGLFFFAVLAVLSWSFPHPPEWLFWPVILVVLVSLGFTLRVGVLLEDHAREIKKLKEETLVLQKQVTAQSTIMTHVINALDDAPREVVSNTFKTVLAKRVSVNPQHLNDEDKNIFNNAFSGTVLAIIEEIKSPKSE